ncbi:vitamin K epoxide reductase family protein [Micropruina sonneratiae]|uniref:vitamin K epoxide reductase family protein n=1 Tax=Micropruina sonneratiae TaxID=2986940 RepID=UPI0022272B26|nr:vitamin K epoxide reductase family protein [Micropruina sp. KQZ13P-5]MCW3158285.1 vitamin K epoxide reductase family protein [Micropruina sp. KQZ13P-5]
MSETTLLQRARGVRQSNGWIFATMLASALISLTASFVLSVDALILAADPQAALSCNINAVLSCGTVANSWQASLFGFPNAFLGLVAEPVVITIAVASLGGVRFPRWFMLSAQVVYTLGVIFAYWLFFQAYFVIGALCPWCLLVTLSTTLVFTSLTHVNIRDGNLYLPEPASRAAQTFIAHDLDLLVVAVWLMGIVTLVGVKYLPLML